MMPAATFAPFDGKGGSFSNDTPEAELWRRVANCGVTKKAPGLVSQVGPAARDVCIAVGCDPLLALEVIQKIAQLLHDSFAPGASDSDYRGAVRFL